MTKEEQIAELYYEIIDPEIMDFQIHVRKVTGGDSSSMVDSTKLGAACRKAITLAEERGAERAKKEYEKDLPRAVMEWLENNKDYRY